MPTRRALLATAPAALLGIASPAARPQTGVSATPELPPTIGALRDRRSEAIPITLAERECRIARARELLKQNAADALAVVTGATLRYFTGLNWYQSERFFAWVLSASGSPFIVCPAFEQARVQERIAAVPATLPEASRTQVLTWAEDEDPFALLSRALRDRGVSTGRLALDGATNVSFADALAHTSPALTVINAQPITAGCRSIKSPAELALMSLANQVTLSVYEAVFRSLSPGMTNRHVSELIAAGYDRCGFPGDGSCEVGPASALPHGSLTPQRIAEGEIILLDDGCTVEGYQSDISRSFVLGKATDKQKRVFDIVHRAQSAALFAARPGVPCHAPDDAARSVIEQAGFGPGYKFFSHRLGHGIGLEGHEWPYLVRGNAVLLAPGMCFSDEPGIYIPGEFGIRLEDDMHITEHGAELFTPQSPSLEEPFARS